MSYIEIVSYDYGSGTFNFVDNPNKKYRQNVNIVNRTLINKEDIYENKKIHKKIIYFRHKNNYGPMINVFFATDASAKRYLKINKQMLVDTYGKLWEDFYYDGCILADLDRRAV